MQIVRLAFRHAVRRLSIISPVAASYLLYRRGMGEWPNLYKPKLFSEKLMKLKLNNYIHNPIVWRCCDKIAVREYILEMGVSYDHLPNLISTYGDANDIDFDSLPDKFAIKCSHGSGFNIVCTDKSELDYLHAREQLNKWLGTRFGLESAETQYGRVQPRIMCEEYIEGDDGKFPSDYKVYCFSGVPKFVMICVDRKDALKSNIVDLNWEDTNFIKSEFSSPSSMPAPKSFVQMLEIAKMVSTDFPFVRVDFYEHNGIPVIGELTFTPHACVNGNMTTPGQLALGQMLET